MLLIDRGSREKDAGEELAALCKMIKQTRSYDFVDYCFLEVLPPFIEEGITNALKCDLNELTLVPYFLYPGKKVKAAVTSVMAMQKNTKTKFLVTRPMSMHPIMTKLVSNRISSAKNENKIKLNDKETDILIIGHGSMDPNAALSIQYVVNNLKSLYRNVTHCFLEIEKPDIKQGISTADSPKVLVIVFYFLHKGAQVLPRLECGVWSLCRKFGAPSENMQNKQFFYFFRSFIAKPRYIQVIIRKFKAFKFIMYFFSKIQTVFSYCYNSYIVHDIAYMFEYNSVFLFQSTCLSSDY